jgi:hypothetical protein
MVDLTLPDVALAQGDVGRRLAERVCAWQHRHPLARRIVPGEVAGWGVIALPYGEAGPGGEPTPLFHQPSLLPGLPHRALVDFAARHGVAQRPGPADWPQRDIERADASAEPAPTTRYLLTAAITDPRSATPRRLLIAPAGPAIWGARPPDRARLGVAALLAAALLALAAWGLVQATRRPTTVPAAPGASAASVASAVQPASAPALPPAASARPSSAPALPASASALPAAPPPAPAAFRASAAAAASAALVVVPAASAPRPPTPPASAAALPAATASVPAAPAPAAASAVPVPPPRLLPMPNTRGPSAAASATAPAAASAPASAAPLAAGPHYALVSMPARKRAEAEATLLRVRQLLGPAIGPLQAQVMPSPQGFVVTLWPLPSRADAEHLAEVLGRRGVPMKWMEF